MDTLHPRDVGEKNKVLLVFPSGMALYAYWMGVAESITRHLKLDGDDGLLSKVTFASSSAGGFPVAALLLRASGGLSPVEIMQLGNTRFTICMLLEPWRLFEVTKWHMKSLLEKKNIAKHLHAIRITNNTEPVYVRVEDTDAYVSAIVASANFATYSKLNGVGDRCWDGAFSCDWEQRSLGGWLLLDIVGYGWLPKWVVYAYKYLFWLSNDHLFMLGYKQGLATIVRKLHKELQIPLTTANVLKEMPTSNEVAAHPKNPCGLWKAPLLYTIFFALALM